MAPSEQWGLFFQQCLNNRVDAAEFRDLSKLLSARCPIKESALLDTLLDSQGATGTKWDPLLPLYIDCLCKSGRVKTSIVLRSLLKHSSISAKPQVEDQEGKRRCYTLMTDIKVIQDILMSVSTGNVPKNLTEAINIFCAVIDWLQTVLSWNSNHLDEDQQGGLMGSPDYVSLFESLGILLAVLAGAGKGLEVLSSSSHQGIRDLCLSY